MPKCQDEACKKTVEELDLYVKGRPGTDTGLRICLQKFVPKTWIWKFLGWGGIPFVIASFFLFSTVSGGEKDHQQSVREITELKQDIKEIHKDVTEQGKELAGMSKVQAAILEGIKEIRKAQALRIQ